MFSALEENAVQTRSEKWGHTYKYTIIIIIIFCFFYTFDSPIKVFLYIQPITE